uniref:Ig-like domain-containing protein n=2 Tax=Lates calcarifer TaxID=8187 RepID=A0A4W6CV42_LATCA
PLHSRLWHHSILSIISVLFMFFVFLLLSGQAQLSDISQPDSFKAVELGDTVTITCHIHSPARHIMWYKLTTGKRLQFYNLTTFNKEPHRYSVKYGKNNNHLSISATTGEDVGTYYCGLLNVKDIQFGSGTFLMPPAAIQVTGIIGIYIVCSLNITLCSNEVVVFQSLVQDYQLPPQPTLMHLLSNTLL